MKRFLQKLLSIKKSMASSLEIPFRPTADRVDFQNKSVKLIAHRGLSVAEPENSVASFLAAGEEGYYGIETDVHKTKDGNYVVIHDNTTGRVADKDISVEKSTLSELRALRLKGKDGEIRDDLTIPTLSEYIAICKEHRKVAVIELKHGLSDSDIDEIIQILKEERYLAKTIFISFTLSYLVHVRSVLPRQEVQYLVTEFSHHVLDDLKKYHLDIDIYYKKVTQDLVDELKKNNIKINCWTCDSQKEAEVLASLGVDYITTDRLV